MQSFAPHSHWIYDKAEVGLTSNYVPSEEGEAVVRCIPGKIAVTGGRIG
jgi:hypothetical protein